MQQVDLYTSLADAAYQGAPGAFSEEAARVLLGEKARLMPCAGLEQTFEAVADHRAQHAVLPVEDAISGTLPSVYEHLLTHDLVVSGETTILVDHVLVAAGRRPLSALRRVLSHPIALSQCGDFFRQNRHLEAVSVFDTAGAVRLIVDAGDGTTAAIASQRAAAWYGGTVIAEHIQDQRDNWTRFLLISHPAHAPKVPAPQKALVALGLRHQPGALVRALTPIAELGLSVTKVEGRPVPGRPGDYRFVVEIVHPEGAAIPPALWPALAQGAVTVKVLGAFNV